MPRQSGKVEEFFLFSCPEAFDHQNDPETCARHTEEETEVALAQLREDLEIGDLIIVRWTPDAGGRHSGPCPEKSLWILPNGEPQDGQTEGSVSVSNDGRSLHVIDRRTEEEYNIPLHEVWSIEVDYLDIHDWDEHPLVCWRHEHDFCFEGEIFHRTETELFQERKNYHVASKKP